MALIRPSGLISAISGTIGGVNFVTSSARPIARAARHRPAQQPTNILTQRTRLAYLTNLWTRQTSVTRAAWSTLAATIRFTDRLGQARAPTGRQFFLQYNLKQLTNALTVYTTTVPTVLTGMIWTSSNLIAASPTDIQWDANCTGHPFIIRFALYAQAFYRPVPQFIPATYPAEVGHLPKRWRWFQTGSTPAAGPAQLYPAITNAIGSLQSGQVIAVRAKTVIDGYFINMSSQTTATIP